MTISFFGAARTVTGSKHLLTREDGKKILLDCGMFQGLGARTPGLNQTFGFEPKEVDCVLLSHAHIDHSGLLPKLVKEGFSGKIYATAATAQLAEILLHDSAEIQGYDADGADALYTHQDVMDAVRQFEMVDFHQPFQPVPGVRATLFPNGHLIGSAAISLHIEEEGKETNLLFSGDVGKTRSALLPAPEREKIPVADYIIMESTYGDAHHNEAFNNIENLSDWIHKTCVQRKGKLIIPAFSVGRTQEILYMLNQLELENRLPDLPVYIDSPLSLRATETIKQFPDLFNERLQSVLKVDDDPFQFKGLKYVESVEDSRTLAQLDEPCIIISASGTADAGRVRHHIFNCVASKKNTILFAGYCGRESLGAQLLGGSPEISLFGKQKEVLAEVGKLKGMSAHGDCEDLLKFLESQTGGHVKGVFLVHGEWEVQQAFKTRLEARGFSNVSIPEPHEQVRLQPAGWKEQVVPIR